MQQTMHINPESELSRQLKEAAAAKKPLRLVSGGTIFDVQVHELNTPLGGRRFDPAAIRAGLNKSAGALKNIDAAGLKRELREAREQDSAGRPATL